MVSVALMLLAAADGIGHEVLQTRAGGGDTVTVSAGLRTVCY